MVYLIKYHKKAAYILSIFKFTNILYSLNIYINII